MRESLRYPYPTLSNKSWLVIVVACLGEFSVLRCYRIQLGGAEALYPWCRAWAI